MVEGRSLRVLLFGTPAFAVPTLEALIASRHDVQTVVTQPDRPSGRGQKTNVPAVKRRAMDANIPVLQPDRLKDEAFLDTIRASGADLGVVIAYGKILPDGLLAIPRLGFINVHASLLPRYRGAAPVHRAVIAGESKTGVTIMRVVKALDAGPMLARVERPIGPDETSGEVERDLAARGATLLVEIVDALATGPIPEEAQNDSAATYAHRLTKDEGRVDWGQSAQQLHNQIRGLYPWPHAFTYHQGKRLILLRSETGVASDRAGTGLLPSHAAPVPGSVLDATGDRLIVATGEDVLAIRELQAEGRRPMTAREFLAGYRIAPGDRLSSEP
jgi:methionyl-tRNA formyltransferase